MSGERSFLAQHFHDYPELHRDRTNLALHLVLVPMFQAGVAASVAGLALQDAMLVISGLGSATISMIVQGRGHAREATQPKLGDPMNLLARIFAEQFVSFPRFVLGGGWLRAWRASAGSGA